MLYRRLAPCVLLLSFAIVSPAVRAATDQHFDYASFETGFGQSQFDVLNYPSINGNYMMNSTDTHRPQEVANNNDQAEFYNNFNADYSTQVKNGTVNALAEADAIKSYTTHNSPTLGPPKWLVLNEISAGAWPTNPGAPSLNPYRQWVIDCVTKLHDTYGYRVVTYAPFAAPATGSGSNAPSWTALAAVSYIAVENYLSGQEVMNGGSSYASRVAWAQAQYQASMTNYSADGVPVNEIFLGEHFGNTVTGTGYGRAGISASDWDTVLQIRQDAIRNVGFSGFLAYDWGGNQMGITTTEMIEHEDWYRTRLTLPGQQPQWLADAAWTIGNAATPVALSWSEQLNWLGGVPNANGAIANFYRTNTAARTITLDGSQTVGTLSFNSPNSYTINPGTGGTLTLNNAGSSANLTVTQGTHTIAVPVALAGNATFNIAGTLSLTAGFSSTTAGTITRSGTGSLNISGTQTHAVGESFVANAGTTTFNSDSAGLAVTINAATVNFAATQTLGALTINSTGNANSTGSGSTINAATLAITGGKLDLADDAMVIRSGTIGSPTSNIYNGLTGLIQSGRNSGAWNGNGIITSMTAAKSPSVLNTLAIAKASDALNLAGSQTTTWRGQTVDANAILVMYTYAGDANLDGKINADDYFQIDSNLSKPASSTSYFHGDFNYDGKINGDDYFIIDSNFAAHGAPFSTSLALDAPIAVPEPSGVVATIAALSFIAARRRRLA